MKRGRGVHAEDGNGFALIDEFPDESVCQRTLPGTRRTGDADDVLFGCGGKGAEQFLKAIVLIFNEGNTAGDAPRIHFLRCCQHLLPIHG